MTATYVFFWFSLSGTDSWLETSVLLENEDIKKKITLILILSKVKFYLSEQVTSILPKEINTRRMKSPDEEASGNHSNEVAK